MAHSTRTLLSALILSACGAAPGWADEAPAANETEAASGAVADSASQATEASAEGQAVTAQSAAEPSVEVGTRLFDAETVGELFETYQQQNERRAKELAPHLSSGDMQIIELTPVEVQAYHVRHMDELAERINPQPQRRLARLAELDPAAAADLRVTMRAEERFFAGEEDATYDPNAGRVAEVDLRDVASTVATAVQKAKESSRAKRVTDDQPTVPAGQ